MSDYQDRELVAAVALKELQNPRNKLYFENEGDKFETCESNLDEILEEIFDPTATSVQKCLDLHLELEQAKLKAQEKEQECKKLQQQIQLMEITNDISLHLENGHLREKIQEMENENRQLTEQLQERNCQLCCENKADRIFLPCGHIVSCQFCVEKINNRCVLCRNVIDSTLKVYF